MAKQPMKAASVVASSKIAIKGNHTRKIPQDDLGVSFEEAAYAIFSEDFLYEFVDCIPQPDPRRGGRPPEYPKYLVLAIAALNDVYCSNRQVATEFFRGSLWKEIRRIVHEKFPNDRTMHLPAKPPSRTWFAKTRGRHVTSEVLEDFKRTMIETTPEVALEVGVANPNGPGTRTHPHPDRLVSQDGKVLAPITNATAGTTRKVTYLDIETGDVTEEEVPVRFDPDAKEHHTGDNRVVVGNKFWHAEIRGSLPHQRVILAIDEVPDVKGTGTYEAAVATRNLLELLPRMQGVLGAVGDTALRGEHIEQLIRETGRLIICPVTAKETDKKTGDRTEKERFLRTIEFHQPDGTVDTVDLHYYGGAIRRLVIDGDGTRHLVPLERTGNPSRPNKGGTYRDYVEYRVPNPRDGLPPQTVRESTITSDDDRGRNFNRSENVRQIPPGDPTYDAVYGRREDSESTNRGIDDHLPLRRARSYGRTRQVLDLIGAAIRTNSIALARHGHAARNRRAA